MNRDIVQSMVECEYSILMSVYTSANSNHLSKALDSIYRQTSPPSEIVLVKDGRLTSELEAVIYANQQKQKSKLVTVELEQNTGLGTALQFGLEACAYPIIARMDADDIATPERCEKQLNFLADHPEIDAVGAWISEFDRDENNICAHRVVPDDPDKIIDFAKWRNPINHMSVMFRKEKVILAGGYLPLIGFEDYYLWIRMLLNGSRLGNIPEVLMNVRAGADQLSRRGGIDYVSHEFKFQSEILRRGFITTPEFIRNICIRFVTRIAPLYLRRQIYRLIRERLG